MVTYMTGNKRKEMEEGREEVGGKTRNEGKGRRRGSGDDRKLTHEKGLCWVERH